MRVTVSPYAEFVHVVVHLARELGLPARRAGVALAREAWADVYHESLRAGRLSPGRFELFLPAIEKLDGAMGDDPLRARLTEYRDMFELLAREGVDAVDRRIRADLDRS